VTNPHNRFDDVSLADMVDDCRLLNVVIRGVLFAADFEA